MPNSTPPVRTRRVPQPQDPAIAALRVDHERVFQALDRRRRQQRLRWNEIAATFAVCPPTVTGWGRGIGLNADHLARALEWLGADLTDFVTGRARGAAPGGPGEGGLETSKAPACYGGGHQL